jgi:sensor histidine kinase regulating citrate/malate metabolism
LVWNSLDADATEVNVIFSLNALGGIDSIVVTDNGSGISKERAEHDFESLGDSWKRTWRRFYLVMWTLLSQLSSCLERRNTSFS